MRNEIYETDVKEVADLQVSGLEKYNGNEESKKIMSIRMTKSGIAKKVIKTIKIRKDVGQQSSEKLEEFLHDSKNSTEEINELFDFDFQNSTEEIDELFELYFGV